MDIFERTKIEEYAAFLNEAVSYGECTIFTYKENQIHQIHIFDGKERKRKIEKFTVDVEMKKYRETVEKYHKIHTAIKFNARMENKRLLQLIMDKMNFKAPIELINYLGIPYHRFKNWTEFFPYDAEVELVKEKCGVELIRKPEYLTLREIERRVRVGELT